MHDRAPDRFSDRLASSVLQKRSTVCVGLDPDLTLMPPAFVERYAGEADPTEAAARCCADFCIQIIDAVAGQAAAVKPQAAFFEQYGAAGWTALGRVVAAARERHLLVLLDAKRGDISSTARAYAAAVFGGAPLPGGGVAGGLGADAVTLNPYLGSDSVSPFLDYIDRGGKGVFVLTRTSNPGAADLQEVLTDREPVYMLVAALAHGWGEGRTGEMGYSDVGVVAGATAPKALAAVRNRLPNAFILIPGVGAQGGDIEALRGLTVGKATGLLINASRSILYAWRQTGDDFRDAAANAARELREQIGRVLTL